MSAQLERRARQLWISWGAYAKRTHCVRCGCDRYCRARYASGPFWCVDCWDQR